MTGVQTCALPISMRPTAQGSGGQVAISGYAFTPATLSVEAGQPIVWTNKDPVPHTVTSADGLWDSGEVQPGASFTLTLDHAGAYKYHCSIHPFMQATITVTSKTGLKELHGTTIGIS